MKFEQYFWFICNKIQIKMNLIRPKGITKTIERQKLSIDGCFDNNSRCKSNIETVQRLSTTKSTSSSRSKKGIKVTQIHSSSNLALRPASRVITIKKNLVLNNRDNTYETNQKIQQNTQSPVDQIPFSKRCVQYKNKKIVQHKIFPQPQSHTPLFIHHKRQEDVSTCKNTPRDFEINSYVSPSQGFNLLSARTNISDVKQLTQPKQFKTNTQYVSVGKQTRLSNPETAIEKNYYVQNGKKVITVHSRNSSSEVESQSIAEPHDWRDGMI